MGSIQVVSFSNYKPLGRLIADLLAENGHKIEYLDYHQLNEAQLILFASGNTSACEMENRLLPYFRPKSLVVIKPGRMARMFRFRGFETGLEERIRNLGYPFVRVGEADDSIETLAKYAVQVIISNFIKQRRVM